MCTDETMILLDSHPLFFAGLLYRVLRMPHLLLIVEGARGRSTALVPVEREGLPQLLSLFFVARLLHLLHATEMLEIWSCTLPKFLR